MGNIFGTLNTGYSGLKANQTGIDVTGHNVSNASNDHYTRQRAVMSNATPLKIEPGDKGLGTQVSQIVRIHDEFVFQRYQEASNSQENSGYKQDIFNTMNTYFPEVDEVGVHKDLKNYFDSWQSLSNNPDDGAIKQDLATYTQTMTNSLQTTREKTAKLQNNINDDIKIAVEEVNRLSKGIAELNQKINTHEAGGNNNANDLRDQRDKLEKALNDLVDTSISKTHLSGKSEVDKDIVDNNENYTLNIGGFNIVDGSSFHPLKMSSDNTGGFHEISYKRSDWKEFGMEDSIKGGRLGAMLDMRGRKFDESKGGFTDGEIQKTLDGLDKFANALVESTNNIYAQSPQTDMKSSAQIKDDMSLLNSDLNITEGSFNVNVFNNAGEVVATKEVTMDSGTTFDHGSNSLTEKINNDTDDNDDNNANNDVDDFVTASVKNGQFILELDSSYENSGYKFNITETDSENKTNFAGAMGMNQYFEGKDASDIRLQTDLAQTPNQIQAGITPSSGDSQLANDMQQLQYDKVSFHSLTTGNVEEEETLERYFTSVAGSVASRSADVNSVHDSNEALFNSVKGEFDSISKVSIDEEMTNLIKYQTGYQAAAKVITTVDQMVNSLLQIKQ